MQQAITDFKTSLQRIRNLADDVLANAQQALRDPALRERQDTALSAVVVTMAGYFESFLRDVAEQYVDTVCQQNHPFQSLKRSITYTHFQGGGKVLTAIGGKKRPPSYSWTSADAVDIAKRLASVDTGPPYDLIWEAFAETNANPGSETVGKFLERFGVEKPIETLAAHMGVGTNAVSIPLNSFISVRNECAHSGEARQTPTASEVVGYCDLLIGIGEGIAKTLTAHSVC